MAYKIKLDAARRVDIECRKGDTFVLNLNFTDAAGDAIDLSLYTWRMDVKDSDNSVSDIIPETDFSYTGDVDGNLEITATSSAMSVVDGGLYVYDLESTDGLGKVTTWLYGVFQVNEDISE